jgi:hypothetical protein
VLYRVPLSELSVLVTIPWDRSAAIPSAGNPANNNADNSNKQCEKDIAASSD